MRIADISASTFSDLFYILRKNKGKSLAIDFLRHIVSFCQIATVDDAVIRQALAGNFKDFEDAIQYNAAIASPAMPNAPNCSRAAAKKLSGS